MNNRVNWLWYAAEHPVLKQVLQSVALGPVSVGGTDRLFHIPPTSPAMAPFNVTESSPFWDQNTYVMGVDTVSMEGDGLYIFRLEVYNKSGVRMTGLPKALFQVPHPSSFAPSVVAPDIMQSDVAGIQSNGLQVRVRINNQRCEAAVYKVKLNGVDASPDCCGFVKYGNPAAAIEIGFKAMHPHNHAEYDFTIQKGTCDDPGMSGLTNVSDSEVIGNANGYTRDANGIYRKTFTPLQLLGVCASGGKGAFAEQVYVRAHAINGNIRLSGYDAPGLAAFALEP